MNFRIMSVVRYGITMHFMNADQPETDHTATERGLMTITERKRRFSPFLFMRITILQCHQSVCAQPVRSPDVDVIVSFLHDRDDAVLFPTPLHVACSRNNHSMSCSIPDVPFRSGFDTHAERNILCQCFQRGVAHPDPERPTNFFWYHNAAKIINSPDDSCCFHFVVFSFFDIFCSKLPW